MKTTAKKTKNMRLMLLNTCMLSTLISNAETTNNFMKSINDSFSGDSLLGAYVVGIILIIGVIKLYVSRDKKGEIMEHNTKNNIRPITQKTHYHNRVIKKTA